VNDQSVPNAALQRIALAGAILVSVHSLVLFMAVLPPNPVRAFVEPRATYLHPFFYQVWDLFAPPGFLHTNVLATIDGHTVNLTRALAERERGRIEPSLSRQLLWQATDAAAGDVEWSATSSERFSPFHREAAARSVLGIEKGLYPGRRYGPGAITLEIHSRASPGAPVQRLYVPSVRDDTESPCCSIASP